MADTQKLVDELRARGAESSLVEVKAGAGGLPKSLPETISAFANGSGGTILVGLDDRTFQPVGIDSEAIRDGLAGMAADSLHPPVRGDIEIDLIDDGHRVVRFDVPEVHPGDKPCYVKARGRYSGSYIRGGDGDRRLSQYEIDRLIENSTQPAHDREIVADASMTDLDPALLDPYLDHMRSSRPRAFVSLDRDDLLRNLGVAAMSDGALRPTVGGLLVFGRYPQQYFPQLFLSVVVLPGISMGELGPGNERFLDNRSIEGSLPHMAADAVTAITRHLTRTSIMQDGQRIERLEYPLEVVRELIVNALMHRDYSPLSHGAQVQVELYADRFVVRSPGGFYGLVQAEDLGGPDVSSSRNALIAKLLTDTPLPGTGHMVAENRGSGIPTVLRALNRAGMAPPTFSADLRRVEVTVPHHALLTSEVLDWIRSLGHADLTQAQVQALAVMHDGSPVRNQTLQGWGLHSADATRELTNLVQRGLADKVGDRKWASYRLTTPPIQRPTGHSAPSPVAAPRATAPGPRGQRILDLFSSDEQLTATQIQESVGVGYVTAIRDINLLIDAGLVIPTAPPKSRNRAYRLADPTPRSTT